MSEGIEIAQVGYRCRTCGTPTKLAISPRHVDGERHICPQNHRLATIECETCEQERVHVFDHPAMDEPRDGAPITDLAYGNGGDECNV